MVVLPVRTQEGYPIWHVRACQAEIGCGGVLPLLSEVNAVATYDGKARSPSRVKAGSADDGVAFDNGSVFAEHAIRCDTCSASEMHVDIRFLDGMQVWVSRCDSPTGDWERGRYGCAQVLAIA